MADTWTYAAGVWTLALDGSGSGQESRHKDITGLTASTLYTFYSTVNAARRRPGAVHRGRWRGPHHADRTGLAPPLVRGTTDGSGGIRLRRGVADAGGAPASATSDTLQYASQGAAEAADWTFLDASAWSFSFNTGHAIAGSGQSSSMKIGRASGLGGTAFSTLRMYRTFNVGAGAVVQGRLWGEGIGSHFAGTALRIENSTGSSATSNKNDGDDGVELMLTSGTVTAGGDGLITASIYVDAPNVNYGSAQSFYFSALELLGAGSTSTVTWTDWDYCIGTGMPQDPVGGDPEDPPPVDPHLPPPVVGVRPFGAYDIPTGAYGYWNSTVKELG
jgi:hypothetical protein